MILIILYAINNNGIIITIPIPIFIICFSKKLITTIVTLIINAFAKVVKYSGFFSPITSNFTPYFVFKSASSVGKGIPFLFRVFLIVKKYDKTEIIINAPKNKINCSIIAPLIKKVLRNKDLWESLPFG